MLTPFFGSFFCDLDLRRGLTPFGGLRLFGPRRFFQGLQGFRSDLIADLHGLKTQYPLAEAQVSFQLPDQIGSGGVIQEKETAPGVLADLDRKSVV